jgi:archaellum component FlaC
MSNEVINEILKQFAAKADGIENAILRLSTVIETFGQSQQNMLAKLDAIHLELRELKTALTVALQRR